MLLRELETKFLFESTRKDLLKLADENFLRMGPRSEEVTGLRLEGVQHDTCRFSITGSTGKKYTNLVKFHEWDDVLMDDSLSTNQAANLLISSGNISLHCSCESFLYYGYQYLLTVMDASVLPENRKPRIKNPHERGICCKHLYRTMKSLPFLNSTISRAINIQRGQR